MSEYKQIPVEVAKGIAETHERDIVIICCWSHEHKLLHTTTYGVAPADKVSAAKGGETCAKALGFDISESTKYEDFRDGVNVGKQRAMEEAIKKHLPSLQKMADQILDPPNSVFNRMVTDFRKALGE